MQVLVFKSIVLVHVEEIIAMDIGYIFIQIEAIKSKITHIKIPLDYTFLEIFFSLILFFLSQVIYYNLLYL